MQFSFEMGQDAGADGLECTGGGCLKGHVEGVGCQE